jgi:hypothetical protein
MRQHMAFGEIYDERHEPYQLTQAAAGDCRGKCL